MILLILLIPVAIYMGINLLQGKSGKPRFSSERATKLISELSLYGSRANGTPGHDESFRYIRRHLLSSGFRTIELLHGNPGAPGSFQHIIGTLPGSRKSTIMLGTFYDREKPEDIGNPDSIAILLELARVLPSRNHKCNIWIAFLDGRGSSLPISGLIKSLKESGELLTVSACIILDVNKGGRYSIEREGKNLSLANGLCNQIVKAAGKTGQKDLVSLKETGETGNLGAFSNEGIATVKFSADEGAANISRSDIDAVGRILENTINLIDSSRE